MTRWQPDGRERLQHAAMTLFQERGYDAVTVNEIAEHAGLTKRSFFNHFADKREVPFAGSAALRDDVVRRLREGDQQLAPFAAALDALTGAGLELADYAAFARMRRDLIDSSPDLQERDLVKTAALTAAVAEQLTGRGVPPVRARFAASSAMTVFGTAFDAWADEPTADFAVLMRRGADELRAAVGAAGAAGADGT